jgi:hypothetical protein
MENAPQYVTAPGDYPAGMIVMNREKIKPRQPGE